ncbi:MULTISPECIES: hypothetical protein [unclassified Streptomyces]|uniref:hypothetical protein n=1 Tax=unclassified Streptomyces TaxID=2593676 RepID=UPI0033BD5C83
MIAFKFQTGTQGVHLPEKYGNWRGIYIRLRMWALDGTWERVFIALMAQADADEDLNWAVRRIQRSCSHPSMPPGPACGSFVSAEAMRFQCATRWSVVLLK